MLHKHYRIISAPRFITFLVVCTLLIIYTAVSISGLYDAEGLTKDSYTSVEISEGDTLWNLANQYCSEDTDLRQAVYKICQLNDITADSIQAGDVILIPGDV